MKRIKWFAGFVILLAVSIWFGKENTALAEVYFSWDEIEHYDVSALNCEYQSVAMVYDDDALYIHAIQRKGRTKSLAAYADPVVYCESGEYPLELAEDAECTFYEENGLYAWEAVIPLGEMTDIQRVSMNIANQWWELRLNFLPQVIDEAYRKPSDYVFFGSDGIVIDGYYDDWSDKPHALVTNKGIQDRWRTEENCRQLSMFHDEEYVYFHLKMESNGKDPLKGEYFVITIEGKPIEFHICDENGKKFHTQGKADGIYKVYIYLNGSHWQYASSAVEDAYAYVTVGDIDECEVALPFTMWSKVYGITLKDVKEIRLRCPGIFTEEVCNAGTSTGPIVGVTLCAAVSIAGGVGLKRKKRKTEPFVPEDKE